MTSLVTRTNHNTILTIDIYVRSFPDSWPRRTDFHTTPALSVSESLPVCGCLSVCLRHSGLFNSQGTFLNLTLDHIIVRVGCIFGYPKPVQLTGGVVWNLRFELKLSLFSRQSSFHLRVLYDFFVNTASTHTYYKLFILFHQSKFTEEKVILIV